MFLPGSSKENALRCSLAEAPGPWTPPAEALTAAMARFIHGSPTAIALVYVETRVSDHVYISWSTEVRMLWERLTLTCLHIQKDMRTC